MVLEELLEKGKADYSPAGLSRAKKALASALDSHRSQEAIFADCESHLKELTTVVIPKLQSDMAATKVASKGHLKAAVLSLVFQGGDLAQCAQVHATAEAQEGILNAALLYVGSVEIPAAILAVRSAEYEVARTYEDAVRAEALVCVIECLTAATPLLQANGGELELLINGGKVAEYVKYIHAASVCTDFAKQAYDAEVAKQAAAAQKLQ